MKHKLYYPPALEDLKVISHTEERLKSVSYTDMMHVVRQKAIYVINFIFNMQLGCKVHPVNSGVLQMIPW